jgi:hypothetical protein
MKILLLISLLAFNATATEDATRAEVEARCYLWGSIAGLKKETLASHKQLAANGLSETDMAFEIGYAVGIARGLAEATSPESFRQKTYQLYATICLKS